MTSDMFEPNPDRDREQSPEADPEELFSQLKPPRLSLEQHFPISVEITEITEAELRAIFSLLEVPLSPGIVPYLLSSALKPASSGFFDSQTILDAVIPGTHCSLCNSIAAKSGFKSDARIISIVSGDEGGLGADIYLFTEKTSALATLVLKFCADELDSEGPHPETLWQRLATVLDALREPQVNAVLPVPNHFGEFELSSRTTLHVGQIDKTFIDSEIDTEFSPQLVATELAFLSANPLIFRKIGAAFNAPALKKWNATAPEAELVRAISGLFASGSDVSTDECARVSKLVLAHRGAELTQIFNIGYDDSEAEAENGFGVPASVSWDFMLGKISRASHPISLGMRSQKLYFYGSIVRRQVPVLFCHVSQEGECESSSAIEARNEAFAQAVDLSTAEITEGIGQNNLVVGHFPSGTRIFRIGEKNAFLKFEPRLVESED